MNAVRPHDDGNHAVDRATRRDRHSPGERKRHCKEWTEDHGAAGAGDNLIAAWADGTCNEIERSLGLERAVCRAAISPDGSAAPALTVSAIAVACARAQVVEATEARPHRAALSLVKTERAGGSIPAAHPAIVTVLGEVDETVAADCEKRSRLPDRHTCQDHGEEKIERCSSQVRSPQ
jgi:hypothetical protein